MIVDQSAELGPLHPSRGDEDGSALLPGLVERNNVGVVKRGDRSGLAAQAFANDRVARDVGLDQLEGDRPVELQLAGAVEDPDSAGAHDALHLVSGEAGTGSAHAG